MLSKSIEIRKASKALTECPGWTDLVRPEIDRHLHKLEDDILNDPTLSTKELEDKRAAYAALLKLLRDLKGYVTGALASMTEDETALFPRSVRTQIENLFSPPLRGIPASTVQDPDKEPPAKIEFPPAHQFNPFAAKFTPEPMPAPPDPPSTTVNNGQPPPTSS